MWFHNPFSQLYLFCNVCTKQEFSADAFIEHFKIHTNTTMIVTYYEPSNCIIIKRKSEIFETLTSDLSEKSTQTTECSCFNTFQQSDLSKDPSKRINANALNEVKQCKVIIKFDDIEACRVHLSSRGDEKNVENFNQNVSLPLQSPQLVQQTKFQILFCKRLKQKALKFSRLKNSRTLSKLLKFTCAVCERKFLRMKELCSHMKKAHARSKNASKSEEKSSPRFSSKSEAAAETVKLTKKSQQNTTHSSQPFDGFSMESDDLDTCDDYKLENLDRFIECETTSVSGVIDQGSNDMVLRQSDLRPSRNADFNRFDNTCTANSFDRSKMSIEDPTTLGAQQLLRSSVESSRVQDGVVDLRRTVTTQCQTNNFKNQPEATHESPQANLQGLESRFKPTSAPSIAGACLLRYFIYLI